MYVPNLYGVCSRTLSFVRTGKGSEPDEVWVNVPPKLLAQHTPAAAALTGGYHLAFWIACGLVIAAAGITATMLRQQPALPPPPQPLPELAAAPG
jgi:hypothetical protein